jgi:hypothetical protein
MTLPIVFPRAEKRPAVVTPRKTIIVILAEPYGTEVDVEMTHRAITTAMLRGNEHIPARQAPSSAVRFIGSRALHRYWDRNLASHVRTVSPDHRRLRLPRGVTRRCCGCGDSPVMPVY